MPNVSMSGVREWTARLRDLKEKFPDRVKAALYHEANIEMTESKRRVPVDTGSLRASGYVAQPERDGNKLSVELGYNKDYAVYVHENLEALHPHGEAKFLESVLTESAGSMAQRIATRVGLDQ